MNANLFEKDKAVRTLVLLVGVGKELSNIAKRRRTKQGIRDGVKQNVCIGVTEQSQRVGNIHAAKDQLASLHQTVYVVSVSDPHCVTSLCARIKVALATSSGVVIFKLSLPVSTSLTGWRTFSIS